MFRLSSPTIEDGGVIPRQHARDGGNLSPEFSWTDPPKTARSFVLVMEDPDAPQANFKHWAIYNIPGHSRHLPPGRSSGARAEALPHGVNDFGNAGYDGPQPPAGDPPHTYRFRLAALNVDALPVRGERPSAAEVWRQAQDYMVTEAGLVARYGGR